MQSNFDANQKLIWWWVKGLNKNQYTLNTASPSTFNGNFFDLSLIPGLGQISVIVII